MRSVATHQKTQQGLKQRYKDDVPRRTHVATHQKTQQGLKHKANKRMQEAERVATHQKTQQGLKLPSTDDCWGNGVCRRNASENPAGIETTGYRIVLPP